MPKGGKTIPPSIFKSREGKVCFGTIVTFFFIAAQLKIYQKNKEYIF
jgi:hypothetical protein